MTACTIAQLPYEEFKEWFYEQSKRQRQIEKAEDITVDLFHHMFCDECRERMLKCQ